MLCRVIIAKSTYFTYKLLYGIIVFIMYYIIITQRPGTVVYVVGATEITLFRIDAILFANTMIMYTDQYMVTIYGNVYLWKFTCSRR